MVGLRFSAQFRYNPLQEWIGLTVVSSLSPQNIEFKDNVKANENIITGLQNIRDAVNSLCLSSFPPIFEDIYK